MTQWRASLGGPWGPVQYGGGVLFVGCLGGHCADGVCGGGLVGVSLAFGVFLQGGLSAEVWGLSRPSSLGGGPQSKFIGDTAWGMGVFGLWISFWFPCHVGAGFLVGGGALCGAGVCRPFSVLICRHDGFLGVLLVGLFYCIVWGFLGLHSFVRGVYVGFVCCAGILISLLSFFRFFSVKVVL